MAFPSREEKFLSASHVALSLAYVILANHDHVKLHLLQNGAGGASPVLSRPAPHDGLRRFRRLGEPRRARSTWPLLWVSICSECAAREKLF